MIFLNGGIKEEDRMKKTMVGQMVIYKRKPIQYLVHSADNPSDEEWKSYLTDLEKFFKSHRPKIFYGLLFTDGGGPSAVQRRDNMTLLKKYPETKIHSAVVTSSVIIRGMLTAYHWMCESFFKSTYVPLTAFKPIEILKAIKHANIPDSELYGAYKILEELNKEMPTTIVTMILSNIEYIISQPNHSSW
jgi:hypothetical protein